MKNIKTHTGKLEIIERLKNNMVDNPHYLVRVGGLVCRTRPNGGINYIINHFNGRDVRAKIGTHYGRATLASIRSADLKDEFGAKA